MTDQGWSGEGLENGKPERRAEHATKRSEVECEDRSGGFPFSPRRGGWVHAAFGVVMVA